MIEKIKNLDKEKELNQRPINEGMIKEIDSHKVKFQIMSTIELVKGIILKLIFLKLFDYSEWKNSTEDNKNPFIVCYRPLSLLLFFLLKNLIRFALFC